MGTMDFLEFVCVMTVILVSGGLIFVAISSKNAIKMQELAEKLRISAERSKAAKTRYQEPEDELGAWVPDLMSALGIDPSVLFADELPPELSRFLPMAKGFIQGGGLKKLMATVPTAAPDEAEQRSAI